MNKNPLKVCDINHLDIQKATNNHIDNMHKYSPDKLVKKNSLNNEDNLDDNALKKRKKRNRKKKKKTDDQSQSETI